VSRDGLAAWWAARPQWLRRVLKTAVGVVAFICVLTVTYHTVMIRFEGASPTLAHSLQVVVETVTGTGYGSDTPWTTPVANGLVVLMDLSTFLVLFIVFPYVFQPVLENALSPSLPATVDAEDHVVVCGTPTLTDRLIDELASREIPVVVVTDNEADALDIHNDDGLAIYGSPTDAETLRRVDVDRARAIVVDTGDERAASAVLATREIDSDIRTVAVVDHLDHAGQLHHAGADSVLTPRQLLGRRIAERVGRQLDPTRSDTVAIADGLSLLELTVHPESPLADRRIDEISVGIDNADSDDIGDPNDIDDTNESQTTDTTDTDDDPGESAVSVVGQWIDGRFSGSPQADTIVEPGTVLLVAGPPEPLERLDAAVCRREDAPTVIVAGSGIVGCTVYDELNAAGIDCRVIDIADGPAVDVVGDATTAETLQEAGIDEAAALVVALDDDDATVLTILAADESPGSADSIARLNKAENETNIRRAGADYVLGVSTMAGRLLVSEVLDEPAVGVDRQLRTARLAGDRFGGQRLTETTVADTDCVVVGIVRDGEVQTDLDDAFRIRSNDELIVVGPDTEIGQLR